MESHRFARLLQKWSGFHIAKQGEYDTACGVYCIAAAAEHFGARLTDEAYPLAKVASRPGLRNRMVERGIYFSEAEEICGKLGLGFQKVGALDELFVPGQVGFVVGNFLFDDATGTSPSYFWDHCVLALEREEGVVAVADPHPWKPRVYLIYEDALRKAIEGYEHDRNGPWLARIAGASGKS